MPDLKAGTPIVCSHCKHKIATVKKDLKFGNPICPDDFQFEGQPLRVGGPCMCDNCGEIWCRNQKVSTPYGWLP